MKVCKANLTTIVDYKGGIIMMQIRMLLGVDFEIHIFSESYLIWGTQLKSCIILVSTV